MEEIVNFTPPQILKPWLDLENSMTEKLYALTQDANVQVLKQRWLTSCWFSRYVLNVTQSSLMCREVVVTSSGRVCWYARTIIPEQTFLANAKLFERLMHQSLGKIIFYESEIERQRLACYPVDQNSQEYHWPKAFWVNKADKLWLRFSEFTVNKTNPFYLYEILLPEFAKVLE